MFIRINEDGSFQKYSIEQLQKDNPQTSFPQTPSDETLARYSVFRVTRGVDPEYDPLRQRLKSGEVKKSRGKYTEKVIVEDYPYATQVENLKQARLSAFAEEADPLFFQAQRGEIDISVWTDKVEEIRLRFPYPENPGAA